MYLVLVIIITLSILAIKAVYDREIKDHVAKEHEAQEDDHFFQKLIIGSHKDESIHQFSKN